MKLFQPFEPVNRARGLVWVIPAKGRW